MAVGVGGGLLPTPAESVGVGEVPRCRLVVVDRRRSRWADVAGGR